MLVKDMKRGTIVRALRDLDPSGANVAAGTLGVIYGDANCYGDETGPIVRWLLPVDDATPVVLGLVGTCNVYEGDVEAEQHPDIADFHIPPDVNDGFAVARLLWRSWEPIAFDYSLLTREEKCCITQEQFHRVVEWVRRSRRDMLTQRESR